MRWRSAASFSVQRWRSVRGCSRALNSTTCAPGLSPAPTSETSFTTTFTSRRLGCGIDHPHVGAPGDRERLVFAGLDPFPGALVLDPEADEPADAAEVDAERLL